MTVEKLSDLEPGKAGIVKRWLEELRIADDWEKIDWRQRAESVIDRYEGKSNYGNSSFNVLHSNTETLRPLLFGRAPQPEVRRRKKLAAGPDRMAAELLEGALETTIDADRYEDAINAMIGDYLLAGRGTVRVRYLPTIEKVRESVTGLIEDENTRYFTANMNEVDPGDVLTDDDGAFIEFDSVVFEKTFLEHVHWKDFRHQPARRWQDVRWIAFRHEFNYEEFAEAFGKGKANDTNFILAAERGRSGTDDSGGQPDFFRKAEVWEVWDKTEETVYFVCQGYPAAPLLEITDGPEFYNLSDFFPTPPPLLSVHTPSSLLPIPEFTIYQDLANELDDITGRIERIVDSIRVTGVYDAAISALQDLLTKENSLTPVENFRALMDKGGLKGVVDFMPIDGQVKALVALYQQRAILLDTIYQTVGISDIQRAQSDPRETLGAQQLKSNFGQQRQSSRQREVQRYLRDLMEIQAELIAEKFQPETILLMAGMDRVQPNPQDPQSMQRAMEQEQALNLLRQSALRDFAIDIETDSTALDDQARSQAQLGEMMQGLSGFANAAQALPEGARMPLLRSIVRKFKMGRDVELAIEEAAQQPPRPDPELIKEQQKAQLEAAKLQQKEGDSRRKFQLEAAELALKAQEFGLKQGEAEADMILALGNVLGAD